MRANALLSPHRAKPRPAETHDRSIVTEVPNLMWAIDATQVATVRDGKVWCFAVAEHGNAEALGWHVSKRGTRHEALQAVSMAVRQQFGHLGRDAARGLELRHDHGGAFMAEDFQNQIKPWGRPPSYAFIGQPETNGVIERFLRTFKEQVVHGRIFQTIDDFRDAVRDSVRRYPMAGREERRPRPRRRTPEMARPEPAVRGIVQPNVQGAGRSTRQCPDTWISTSSDLRTHS